MAFTVYDLLALFIITFGIMVQAWVGIGVGLLAAPLLYLINPAYVPGPALVLGVSLSLLVVLKQHNNISWKRVMPAIIARVPGAWCGAALLVSVPKYGLSLMFGASLLLAVGFTWRACKVATTPMSLTVGGFLSGLMGTATSIGGPPIALVYQEQNRITARNEISAFFLIGTPVSIAMLAWQGNFGQTSVLLSLKMMPGVLIGFFLANRLDGLINTTSVKPFLLFMSTTSALLVLFKGVQGWLEV